MPDGGPMLSNATLKYLSRRSDEKIFNLFAHVASSMTLETDNRDNR